ncbi:MAG: gas vesicle protein [Chloroflexi bacterium]|nr:MAG: gas vesicle protein [Chloroflexota bacterium]
MKELTPADASLLELVDRLLHKGVVLAGHATISVAGVDLIYLGLNVVLAAVETIESGAQGPGGVASRPGARPPAPRLS